MTLAGRMTQSTSRPWTLHETQVGKVYPIAYGLNRGERKNVTKYFHCMESWTGTQKKGRQAFKEPRQLAFYFGSALFHTCYRSLNSASPFCVIRSVESWPPPGKTVT